MFIQYIRGYDSGTVWSWLDWIRTVGQNGKKPEVKLVVEWCKVSRAGSNAGGTKLNGRRGFGDDLQYGFALPPSGDASRSYVRPRTRSTQSLARAPFAFFPRFPRFPRSWSRSRPWWWSWSRSWSPSRSRHKRSPIARNHVDHTRTQL